MGPQSYLHTLAAFYIKYELHESFDEIECDQIDYHSSHEHKQETWVPIFVKLKESVNIGPLRHASDHQTASEDNTNAEEGNFGDKWLSLIVPE